MDRHGGQVVDPQRGGRPVSSLDASKANDRFEFFLNASTLKTIFGSYRHICELLHLKPNTINAFYPRLKSHLTSWRAKALWKKFDARFNSKCYGKGKLCANTRVLVIGGGPCGLRTAIEAQLLGAKVVVVEKRDRISRNNVLHLWPFVIDDLRLLGAKKFFGKFCAGSIDHISIRQLQCILLKVALLLGVEIHTEVSFEDLVEPNVEEKTGWRANLKPANHPANQFEFDVVIGADGKRNTLQGFKRKEFRGKLAIAITANFINKHTEAEARVEEISGVAFIFNQKFFKDLYAETGIDLENIVYYKDETHYFVMTAKKHSLIDKGVIKQDLPDTAKLLAPDNVDRVALMDYAREAAEFSTNYNMLDLEFAVNHYGQPDVAMFDFTSMYQAENASKITERHGYKLMSILVGDSLLEPFWPTGSGCARGFLSSLDAGWAIRGLGSGLLTPLEVLAERESIYRLLPQTTPENLNRDYKSYTLDPSTRYPNLNKNLLLPQQVLSLYDSDRPESIELTRTVLPSSNVLEQPKKRKKRDSHVDPDTLLSWIKHQVKEHEDLLVENITTSLKDGRILCAVISHYRPDLLDYTTIAADDAAKNNQLAFDLLEKEIGIPPVMTGKEMAESTEPDFLAMVSYLTQIYDTFRCEIPHIKHPKLELSESKRQEVPFTKYHPALHKHTLSANATTSNVQTGSGAATVPSVAAHHRPSGKHKRHLEHMSSPAAKQLASQDRKPRKKRTMEKFVGTSVEDRMKRLEEIALNRNERQNKRRQQRKMQTEQFIKSMQMLQANSRSENSEPFEDYSIFVYRQTAPNFEDRVKNLEKKFTYIPDPENRPPLTQLRGEKDEDFQARIKGMEDKWHENIVTDKKPKDLLRAIGKIDNTDWNIKEIEKKIIENKLGKNVNKDKEKVPKWSKEQFQARQLKMEKQHLERQDSAGAKFAEIDKNIKQLDMKLKEGSALEQNQRKVAQLQEKLAPKEQESKTIQKSNSKAMVFPAQGNSEVCHFCDKRVYLMERLSAEGRFFHRGCFRCQYCQTALRLGSYMFDRDGKYGFRFFCTQHFGMSGERKTTTKVVRRQSQKQEPRSPEKKLLSGVSGVDLLDRVQTPERIEFDLSVGHASSDHDEPLSQMDEDEWTDRNFGASTAEFGSSESESSSLSESESDDEDPFEEAMEEPPTKEGTLKWFGRYKEHYRMHKEHDDSDSDSYTSYDSSYHENSSGEEEFNDTATEGEEEIQAREQRKLEALVQPPIPQVDTGTDTEIASDDLSSSSEIQNSATEISTDSEFAHDDPTPTCEVPSITFNDAFVRKTRGKYVPPQKVQVKSSEIQKPVLRAPASSGKGVDVKVSPLVQAPIVRKPPAQLLLRTEGYALNRTQSTGGIATKVSLELKKKYLLGENNSSNSIQKSDSASTLDSKLRSFNSTITDCQKLLKPSTEISASMQTFCNKLNEQREQRTSPLSPLSSFQKNNIFKIPEKEQEVKLAKTPEKNTIDEKENEKVVQSVVANESEGRPRSPVHETSIVVPQINWKQQSKPTISTSETESSSSTSSSTESEVNSGVQKSASVRAFENIPKVNILSADDEDKEENLDILDSLKYDKIGYSKLETQPNSITEPPKSIASEKKSLNQPKCLPKLEDNAILQQVHSVLHSRKAKPEECAEKSSGHSTPSHESHDQITAVLTETELSDWARDAMVSDDFEESDYEIRDKKMSTKKTLPEGIVFKKLTAPVSNAKSNNNKVCEEDKVECINSVLNPHLDNLVFMDTGSESSSDEVVEVKNNGYVQFHDEEPEDSLSPVVPIVQTTNPNMRKACFDEDLDDASTPTKNTGYCIIGDKNPYGGEVIDLKPIDLAKLKEKQSLCENEEDSLIIVEQNEPSTTEENTCSESTVKNVTQVVPTKKESPTVENNNTMDKKRLEDKLAQVKKDMKKLSEQRKAAQVEEQNMRNNIEFEQHCQRLQSRVDFGNAKDSIDIRKLRRQSKSGSPPKPDLIQDEKDIATSPTRTKKEQIDMERDLNKRLIQEMVMNKMRAENKSLERKRRTRNSFSPNLSPSRPLELSKSPTTDIASHMSKNAPDVLLSTMSVPVQKSQTVSDFHRVTPRRYTPLSGNGRPMSVVLPSRTSDNKLPDTPLTNPEAFSLPDIQKAVAGDMDTPKAPPRVKNVEALKLVEKLKEDARAKAKLLSDVDLGLSPEEKLAQLRKRLNMKRGKENENSTDVHIRDSIESLVINTDRRNSLLYKNDTLSKKKNGSFRRSKSGEDHLNLKTEGRERTKSVGEVCRKLSIKLTEGSGKGGKTSDKCFKSDPNLLLDSSPVEVKKREKKSKDRERRKSITKLFTDLFAKKKEFNVHAATSSGTNKGFLSRISPKGKDKAKDVIKEEPVRRMSYSETRRYVPGNASPPPVPPLPLNYTGTKSMDESSDGEGDWKKDRSSCDTLDQSGIPEGSISSSRRSSRTARKARESQYKRHRMAQEVQRKLEETDVKTRELEQRGVDVEKALRGEADSSKDEADLLKEWFDLMKDLSELRRYERELLVRAQELELEDRYARLQLELKERLDSDGQKTKEDVQKEGNIIQEMMDLAAKRDALLASLEQDKLRFKEEDKGFEEQMLAKGISMTSPLKVTSK